MDSQGPPQTASSINDTTMNDSPPKYVPQFSAATEMILKRISSGTSSSLSSVGITGTPPGYEDMRRSVLQNMKTSMNMEIPSTPLSTKKGGRPAGSGRASASSASATPTNTAGGSASGKKAAVKARAKAGTKRKRAKDASDSEEEEESDGSMSKLGGDSDSDDGDEESIAELPKITQSGRQVNKPTQFVPAAYENPPKRRAPSRKTQEQALCKRCGRGHSPQNNMIVFCDGCNLGWHQMCHDPSISADAVKDESTPWFCADCTLKRSKKDKTAMAGAPSPIMPAAIQVPEPIKGVSGQGRSPEEKRAYLNSLPPPQLVSLLLQATVLHPNLPIFPPSFAQQSSSSAQPHILNQNQRSASASRTHVYPQQPFPPSAAASLFTRVDANPKAPINFIRKITSGHSQSSQLSQSVSAHHSSSAPPRLPEQDGAEYSRESTPASPPYPKAGTGLMSKLGPDDEDIEWLVDDSPFDSEAFSHVVFNESGDKVEENGVAVNAVGSGVRLSV